MTAAIAVPNISLPVGEFPLLHMTSSWYKWAERITLRVSYQNKGWTAATGVDNKGAYASYVGQAMNVGYTQAQAQALDDAVKALSRRVFSLETAIRAAQVID